MQTIVYIFIAVTGLAIGAAGYFGLAFTPIESLLLAVTVIAIAVTALERRLRQRSEARLEKAIGDLSRLLSTNAHAGGTLSQRVAALADQNAGDRLDALEADIAVLGSVVKQVAEAVADLEDRGGVDYVRPVEPEPDPDAFPEAVVPPDAVRRALADGQVVCHLRPIVRLPRRRPEGYLVVPRLQLDDGTLVEPAQFMPRGGHADIVRAIEALALSEAVVIARRSRTEGMATRLHVPLSRATLSEETAIAALKATLDANAAIAGNLMLDLPQAEFRALAESERRVLAGLRDAGVRFAISDAASLRLDFADLEALGVRTIAIDASRFAHRPETFSDFHPADVAAYVRRYDIELVGSGVIDEPQLLRLYEDGIELAEGPHIGIAGPARPDLAPVHPPRGLASQRVGV